MKIKFYKCECENDFCNHKWKIEATNSYEVEECYMCGTKFIKSEVFYKYFENEVKENYSPQKKKKKKKKKSNKRGKRNENSNNNSV